MGFDLTIASFDAISEVSMDYTITMYLNQYWKDDRLNFSPEENKVLTLSGDFAEKIWVPDTFFVNEKTAHTHETTVENSFLRILHTGEVLRSIRYCELTSHYR